MAKRKYDYNTAGEPWRVPQIVNEDRTTGCSINSKYPNYRNEKRYRKKLQRFQQLQLSLLVEDVLFTDIVVILKTCFKSGTWDSSLYLNLLCRTSSSVTKLLPLLLGSFLISSSISVGFSSESLIFFRHAITSFSENLFSQFIQIIS